MKFSFMLLLLFMLSNYLIITNCRKQRKVLRGDRTNNSSHLVKKMLHNRHGKQKLKDSKSLTIKNNSKTIKKVKVKVKGDIAIIRGKLLSLIAEAGSHPERVAEEYVSLASAYVAAGGSSRDVVVRIGQQFFFTLKVNKTNNISYQSTAAYGIVNSLFDSVKSSLSPQAFLSALHRNHVKNYSNDSLSSEDNSKYALHNPKNGTAVSGGLYYIYPWNESYYWRFPLDNSTCSDKGLQHFMFENSGIGRVVDLKIGLMETWHHALFSSLWNRLKRSARRTFDPTQADLFIIPYDITVDSSYKSDCKRQSPEFRFKLYSELDVRLKNVNDLLNESSYFRRFNGADHVALNSYRSFGRSRAFKQKENFLIRICKECLKTCFYRYRQHSDRFIPVPYASSFHYHNEISSLPWITYKKTILMSFVGGWKADDRRASNLRMKIIRQCEESKSCVAKRLHHSDNALTKYKYHEYRNSVFCIQPPGDDPSRKGVVDSILAGCIPVTFHPDTLVTAWPLHLSVMEARQISVYIPAVVLIREGADFNLVDFIENLPSSVILKKQKKIAELGYRLQYSMPPLSYLKNRKDETLWDPPFRDGVDVMLDGMMSIVRKLRLAHSPLSSPPSNIRNLFEYPYNISVDTDLREAFPAILY